MTTSLIAILEAAVVSMLIGLIWYSPWLFGKSWMSLSGLSVDKLNKSKKQLLSMYGLVFVSQLILAFVLDLFLNLSHDVTVIEAFKLSFWIWLGFIITTKITDVIFLNKNIKLYFIDIFYQLFALFGMSIILILWH